ncbi:MAG: lamin tail domain-containing protein [Candidatus Parcubacteria bacterium]|nr:lamin tail domain-containing protein [Candidatus Parcubacteria bacterium]
MKNLHRKLFSILTLIALGFFLCPKLALAQDTDIVVSEIAAFEASDYEWLEIYNKGIEAIDLTGWKFYEDQTNHGLTAFQGDMIIEPNEYAIIADVAANFKGSRPDFTGTILDSSWTTLNENGEEIGLKNKALEIIESFTYISCPDTSLQRIDFELNDYTELNWELHIAADSAGKANEFPEDILPTDPGENPPDDPPILPENIIAPNSIIINEFVSDPSDEEVEWIELYNKNNFKIDLTDWKILDGSNTTSVLSGEIEATAYFVLENPKGKLNNNGDIIILQNSSGEEIDLVYYGDWQAPAGVAKAPAADDPNSTARQIDTNQFVVTQTPTKGAENLITPLPPANVASIIITQTLEQEEEPKSSEKDIIITEIFPNPSGSDLEAEFIELKNTGLLPINLANWKIKDIGKKVYIISARDFPSTIINPGQYFTINRKLSGLALDNDKDTVKLISSGDKTIATIKYQEDPILNTNSSYAIDSESNWYWTTTLTPNENNVINLLNHAPEIDINCPKTALLNELINCDASDSYDLENDALSFTWEIDKQTFTGPIASYQFNKSGTYELALTLSDQKLSSTQKVKIKITEPKTAETATPPITIAKSTTTKKTTTAKKATSKSTSTITNIKLSDFKNYEAGTLIKSTGTVAALPNTFGKTIMYLAGSGAQLYMSAAKWPNLKIGDVVEVQGKISESQGNKRIALTDPGQIKVLESKDPPQPQEIKIEELNDSLIDYLVKITGQLIEKNISKFYIQDETGEAEIYINTLTKIKKTNYQEGDNLSVTGILRKYNGVFQILPRVDEDMVKNIIPNEQTTTNLPTQPQTNNILKYLITTALILVIGLIVIWRHKVNLKLEGLSRKLS